MRASAERRAQRRPSEQWCRRAVAGPACQWRRHYSRGASHRSRAHDARRGDAPMASERRGARCPTAPTRVAAPTASLTHSVSCAASRPRRRTASAVTARGMPSPASMPRGCARAVGDSWCIRDDLSRFDDVRRESARTLLPFEIDVRIRRADGDFRWCQVSGEPVRAERETRRGDLAAMDLALVDIHRHKLAQAELEQALRSPRRVARRRSRTTCAIRYRPCVTRSSPSSSKGRPPSRARRCSPYWSGSSISSPDRRTTTCSGFRIRARQRAPRETHNGSNRTRPLRRTDRDRERALRSIATRATRRDRARPRRGRRDGGLWSTASAVILGDAPERPRLTSVASPRGCAPYFLAERFANRMKILTPEELPNLLQTRDRRPARRDRERHPRGGAAHVGALQPERRARRRAPVPPVRPRA